MTITASDEVFDLASYVYHVTRAENKESIEENGLIPQYNTEDVPIEERRLKIESLLTRLSHDVESVDNINRENVNFFFPAKEQAIEKARSLKNGGVEPLIVAVDYTRLEEAEVYLADMSFSAAAVDMYIHLHDGGEYTMQDYSDQDIDEESVVNTAFKYLATVHHIEVETELAKLANGCDYPEVFITGEIPPENIEFVTF